MSLDAAIAVTRFGLGARPGEIDAVGRDPRGWLNAQIRPSGAPNPSSASPSSDERLRQFNEYNQLSVAARRQRRREGGANAASTQNGQMGQSGQMSQPGEGNSAEREGGRRRPATGAAAERREAHDKLGRESAGYFLERARFAASTDQGFAERWAMFWSNHFTVSATDFRVEVLVDQYERDAIRPHVFGKFRDLALAAEQHPAMLAFLDQAQSVGPNSPGGERREAGLNENLAREAMELHTVGSDSGYSQADVTEFARALTGWTLQRNEAPRESGNSGPNGFAFVPRVHEPGARRVMGRAYAEGGRAQAEAILRDLSDHPATGRRLSRKIAAHFVDDNPPPALVSRLEQAWALSGGDLAVVARALVSAPEAWTPRPSKIKPPYDFIISTHRATGSPPDNVQQLRRALQTFGQPMSRPPSPQGWPDGAADWAGPDALVARLNWASRMSARVNDEPVATAEQALGERLTARTRQFITRAESRPEGLTLLLMSPEFQRR